LLRLTLPGVPDTYQGTELWDFSLVDPDNRRPVDYTLRQRLLSELQQGASVPELLRTMEDGRVKLFVTWKGLACRREHPGLFSTGEYLPLGVAGPAIDHVFAFLRRHKNDTAIVVVPCLLTRLLPDAWQLPLGEAVWKETCVSLPADTPRTFRNVFTGDRLTLPIADRAPVLPLASLFSRFPVALLLADRS
jgi:(1->4)-alpha-D-glucan 1-alpha-D-glucosylmutase